MMLYSLSVLCSVDFTLGRLFCTGTPCDVAGCLAFSLEEAPLPKRASKKLLPLLAALETVAGFGSIPESL